MMSAITQFAELAGAEVLIFEITPERFFGFGDTDMDAPGVAAETINARATGSAALSASGEASVAHDAEATGSMNMQAAGSASMLISIWAVKKKSADFFMGGASIWGAVGVNYTPYSVLTDDAVRRSVECRYSARLREHRGSAVLADEKAHRQRESRGLTR